MVGSSKAFTDVVAGNTEAVANTTAADMAAATVQAHNSMAGSGPPAGQAEPATDCHACS